MLYLLDSELFSYMVKVKEGSAGKSAALEMADPGNAYHVAAPSNGDLWVMYVKQGEVVKKGQELFNISIMKQEKSVTAPMDAVVKRVVKSANYQEDRKMVPVKGGELLLELGSASNACDNCKSPIAVDGGKFCPFCGHSYGVQISRDLLT